MDRGRKTQRNRFKKINLEPLRGARQLLSHQTPRLLQHISKVGVITFTAGTQKQRFRDIQPLPRATQHWRGRPGIWIHASQSLSLHPTRAWNLAQAKDGMALAWSSPSRHIWAPSGHQISRPGAESMDRELLYEEQCCMRNESRYWGREHSGDVAAVFKYLKGCHEEERLDLYWKTSSGVEIKVMDGNDRQSDVSSIHKRLFHHAELERWEDEHSLSPGCPRTGKCWGRSSRIDEQEDSILLKASDGSENPILWSIYTLSDQIWLEITMQLVTLAP